MRSCYPGRSLAPSVLSALTSTRLRTLLRAAARTRILVVGDVMLDEFVWGRVSRISPEAPVPVVEFERESVMPGGAANVARNLAVLGVRTWLAGITGRDAAAGDLRSLLRDQGVDCTGMLADRSLSEACCCVAGMKPRFT